MVIFFLQEAERRTQALGLAAGRFSGALGIVPTVHIQMRPGGAGRHETLQEQRGGHAARHFTRPGIGQIGHVGFQVTEIGLPQRQLPERVVLGFTGRQEGIAAQAMASVRLPEQDA